MAKKLLNIYLQNTTIPLFFDDEKDSNIINVLKSGLLSGINLTDPVASTSDKDYDYHLCSIKHSTGIIEFLSDTLMGYAIFDPPPSQTTYQEQALELLKECKDIIHKEST
jgi:hypothetical protein